MEDNRSERDRGLRGWAKHVYRRFGGNQLIVRSQKSEVRSQKPGISSELPIPISQLRAAKRILVFRIGQLGDTVVALPAMWVVRKSFPTAHLALLCDRHPGKSYVVASDLLRGAGIFDDFLSYPVSESGDLMKSGRMAALLAVIRAKRFDTLIYLAPTNRNPDQIARDRRFFSMAGIKTFVGMTGFGASEATGLENRGATMPRESEFLLRRLASD